MIREAIENINGVKYNTLTGEFEGDNVPGSDDGYLDRREDRDKIHHDLFYGSAYPDYMGATEEDIENDYSWGLNDVRDDEADKEEADFAINQRKREKYGDEKKRDKYGELARKMWVGGASHKNMEDLNDYFGEVVGESVVRALREGIWDDGGDDGRGDNIKRDYNKIMPIALEEIFDGNGGKSPSELINGYVITKIYPESTGRWNVYKRDFKGFMICTSIKNNSITIHVRKPNTHWMDGRYYLVYKERPMSSGPYRYED